MCDELYMYYNHYVSAIQYDVTERKLLPLTDIRCFQQQNDFRMNLSQSAEEILEGVIASVC